MGNTHHLRLMLLGLVGLLALASPGPAAVFCVTGNGHTAIEVLASRCCEDGAASFRTTVSLEPSDSYRPPAACGPCVDLQLTSPSRLEGPAKVAIPRHDTPTLCAAIPATHAAVRIQLCATGHLPTSTRSHELLASVILLI